MKLRRSLTMILPSFRMPTEMCRRRTPRVWAFFHLVEVDTDAVATRPDNHRPNLTDCRSTFHNRHFWDEQLRVFGVHLRDRVCLTPVKGFLEHLVGSRNSFTRCRCRHQILLNGRCVHSALMAPTTKGSPILGRYVGFVPPSVRARPTPLRPTPRISDAPPTYPENHFIHPRSLHARAMRYHDDSTTTPLGR
jgi:hypothetical protein